MRKVTLGLANSLDNYIARKDGGFDWLHWSDEVAEISAKFTPQRLHGDFAAASLELVDWLTDEDELFALSLARPAT